MKTDKQRIKEVGGMAQCLAILGILSFACSLFPKDTFYKIPELLEHLFDIFFNLVLLGFIFETLYYKFKLGK